MSPHVISQ